jgi:hypothetical protein
VPSSKTELVLPFVYSLFLFSSYTVRLELQF